MSVHQITMMIDYNISAGGSVLQAADKAMAESILTALKKPAFVLDDYQGITDAILYTDGGYVLATMIAWEEESMKRRIFGISDLEEHVVKTFLRNMNSEYCDLQRKTHEVDALVSSAGKVKLVIAVEQPDNVLLASAVPNAQISKTSWRQRQPDTRYLQLLDNVVGD